MYGMMFLQDLIRVIPQSGLAKVLSAYLASSLSAFPPEKTDEIEAEASKEEPAVTSPEEILDAMIV
jgi:hypothetical protein